VIVYLLEHPDYGWITYTELAAVMEEIQTTIECESILPGDITITVKAVEMSQEQIDDLPEVEL
jgi:hypothetical protein